VPESVNKIFIAKNNFKSYASLAAFAFEKREWLGQKGMPKIELKPIPELRTDLFSETYLTVDKIDFALDLIGKAPCARIDIQKKEIKFEKYPDSKEWNDDFLESVLCFSSINRNAKKLIQEVRENEDLATVVVTNFQEGGHRVFYTDDDIS